MVFIRVLFIFIFLPASAIVVASVRSEIPLEKNWFFIKNDGISSNEVPLPTLRWKQVTVPHTFNRDDAADGGGYYRGPSWYKTSFTLKTKQDERTFIEFGGAAISADVYLNKKYVGRHQGGFSRFRFDISDFIKPGENELNVRVDNRKFDHIAPLWGDFSIYGGLYGDVKLIKTSAVHIDLLDYASDGVYVHTKDISSSSAAADVEVHLKNSLQEAAAIEVVVELNDQDGRIVSRVSKPFNVAAGSSLKTIVPITVQQPRLWNGVIDPYLYSVKVRLFKQGKRVDEVVQHIGFRNIAFDPKKGLILNGSPYKVYGVNTHLTQRPEKGTAVTIKDLKEDFEILDELGLTGIRLAHYQHPRYIFEHANKKGYLIWAEVPLVSEVNASDEFIQNAKQQLRELIRQNYNHPSVFVWGIGNEIYKADADANRVVSIIHHEAVKEDPSRPTVYANCCGPVTAPIANHSHLNASNIYNGWYKDQTGSMLEWGRAAHAAIPNRPLAISEYGAGGSIYHHELPPQLPETTGMWHPEEYQTLFHKRAWRDLKQIDFLWASFIWVAFDFASDGRSEGDQYGINDKGLVTFDRKTKKDSFYWYKANWSKEPVIHIESKRYRERTSAVTDIAVITNLHSVKLYLNGALVSEQPALDHEVLWSGLRFKAGKNIVKVVGDNGTASDKAEFVLIGAEHSEQ
jgi:beta-galactosidase